MNDKLKILQKTISKQVSFSGIGLHSGNRCNVTLKPGDPDTGIVFIRKDLTVNNLIPADYRYIHKSNLCTTLKAFNSEAIVLTVEHLLAAIKGNSIDNLIIEVDSQEIPILDGAAREYDNIIKSVGIISQNNKYKKFLVIKDKIEVKNKKSICNISPCNSFEVNCTINFPKPIGTQKISLGKSFESIYKKVMDAKTFCYFEDIEEMKKVGLAKGGSLENAIVIKDGTILNPNFNYQSDYFAKHKTLDVLGDFSLMGINIIGSISVYFPGHELNKLAMQKVFSKFSNYTIYQFNQTKKFVSKESFLSI